MNPYDPKLLEAWFRFLAESARQGGVSGPPDLADAFRRYASFSGPPEAFAAMTNTYFEALGFVPKSRYEALEKQYENLLKKYEAAERALSALQGNFGRGGEGAQERMQEAAELWSETMRKTLEAQTNWWRAWTAGTEGKADKDD